MVQLKRGLLHTTALCLGLAAPLIVTSQSAEASCTSYLGRSGSGTIENYGTVSGTIKLVAVLMIYRVGATTNVIVHHRWTVQATNN